MQRFIITIEGQGWSDFEEIELPRLPPKASPLTRSPGRCSWSAEQTRKPEQYDGKILCRMP